MMVVLFATLSPTVDEAFKVLTDISVLLVLTPYIFAAVSIAYYVQSRLLPRSLAWAGLATVIYCLTVILTSAPMSVAISMVLGLSAAPLFGIVVLGKGRSRQWSWSTNAAQVRYDVGPMTDQEPRPR
jgi:arginine:agmatine antiporter